jgi:hypothetical protein
VTMAGRASQTKRNASRGKNAAINASRHGIAVCLLVYGLRST